jgi:hypothetical protein
VSNFPYAIVEAGWTASGNVWSPNLSVALSPETPFPEEEEVTLEYTIYYMYQ